MDLSKDRGGHVKMFGPVNPVPSKEIEGFVDIRAIAQEYVKAEVEQEMYIRACLSVGITPLPPCDPVGQ